MKFLLTLLVLAGLFVSIRYSKKGIFKYGENKQISLYRVKYIEKIISLTLILFYFILLVTVLGIEYSQISFFLSSLFAVLGVVFFAQWSILSNITASLIIFFGFPYRVGDRIKILDKDDDISGVIEEIEMFHVLIRRGDELITYPNSLILQKGVVKNPRANNEPYADDSSDGVSGE